MPPRRAPAGQGSIYFHKASQRWCAELYLGANPITSKRDVWRAYAPTQRELVPLLAAAIRDKAKLARQRAVSKDDRHQTVGAFLQVWLEAVRPSLAPNTIRFHESNVRSLSVHLGTIRLTALDGAAIQRCYAALAKAGRSGKPLSRITLVSIHATLHSALEYARTKMQRLDFNPCAAVIVPRPERKVLVVLDERQIGILFASTAKTRYGPLWRVLVTTGLRIGEATGLQWRNVDLVARTLTIQQQLQRETGRGLVVRKPKTPSGVRTLPLSETTLAALRVQLARQAATGHAGGFVFTNRFGSPVDPSDLRKTLNRALVKSGLQEELLPQLKAAGMVSFRLHGLRHTFATTVLSKGVNPSEVQHDMGHESIVITMDTYAHVIPGRRSATTAAIDAAMGSYPYDVTESPDPID